MKRAMLAVLSIAAGAAWAQTTLTPPLVGFMRDALDSVHPVYGLAGNFLVGDPVASGIVSAAFSGSYGLLKTANAVVVIDRTAAVVASSGASDGPALFALARTGEPALAYLPGPGALLAWKAGTFQAIAFDPVALAAKAVLSIAVPDSDHAALIVQRDDGLWDVRILLATGEIDSQTAISGVAAPAMMVATGELLYSDADGIVIRNADGSERHVAAQLPDSFTLEQMGDGWIQLQDPAGGQQFAVCIGLHREQIYQLPEVSQ